MFGAVFWILKECIKTLDTYNGIADKVFLFGEPDMTSPFEDLILVEIKARLLDLKNTQPLFGHVHQYRHFYSQFNLEQWDGDAQTALEKWVLRLTLNSPVVETQATTDTVFEDLLTIKGKQSEIMEQYDEVIAGLQNSVTPSLSKNQVFNILEYVYECSSEYKHELYIWSQKPSVLRCFYSNASVVDFQKFLEDENISKHHTLKILQHINLMLNDLDMLDRRVVALQTEFSNTCFMYRKGRSQAHFQKEMVYDHTYKFNILEKITSLLHNQTSSDFVEAVHGWGQLYINGQDDHWIGWSHLIEHLKSAQLDTIPVQLHESALNLRQL